MYSVTTVTSAMLEFRIRLPEINPMSKGWQSPYFGITEAYIEVVFEEFFTFQVKLYQGKFNLYL